MDICDPANSLLIITEKGFGKRTDIEEYRIQSRGGKGLLTYKISEKTGELAGMMMVSDADDVMLITTEGVIIRIHAADISTIGRNTSGVRLMRTTENNLIVSCARTDREEDADDADGAEDGDEPRTAARKLDGQSGGKTTLRRRTGSRGGKRNPEQA